MNNLPTITTHYDELAGDVVMNIGDVPVTRDQALEFAARIVLSFNARAEFSVLIWRMQEDAKILSK